MELLNHTPFHADLFRTVIDEERFAAAVVARVTFSIIEEKLVAAPEQPWKLSAAPWESPQGFMDGDAVFYRGGVDFLVFGVACTPGGREVGHSDVIFEVGNRQRPSFRRQIRVFGDRFWRRRHRKLVPSEPTPFREMPLTLAKAFGGKDVWDGLEVAFPANPDGKGFYFTEERAENNPLPNIESMEQPVVRWDDRPTPVGTRQLPLGCALRAQGRVEFNEQGALTKLHPTFFNVAFPGMIIPSVSPGDCVQLTGVAKTAGLKFLVPDLGLRMRLTLGTEVVEQALAIDQIGVETETQRVFISYRFPFRYQLTPLQNRSCELFM